MENFWRKKKFANTWGLFSQNLKFADPVNFVLIKAEKAAHQFWKYMNRFKINCLKTSIIINLFHTLVVPVILYYQKNGFPACHRLT